MLNICPHFCLLLKNRPISYAVNDKMLMRCPIHPIGYNQTVSANSTALVPLNLASDSFLAQLNLNYDASDGSPQKILSPFFNVDDSPQSRPVTWSQGVLAAPTLSPSAVFQTSISTSLLTSSTLTPSAVSSTLSVSKPSSISTSRLGTGAVASTAVTAQSSQSVSKSSPTSNSRLGAGAIAGIVVGIFVCVGLAASLVFYRRRRTSRISQTEIETPPSAEFQSPIPDQFLGEKDATPLQPPELSEDCQLVEMATRYHGEMNVSMGRA